jgi:hypothetical protein
MKDPEIRWLYPTSTVRKSHAFMPFAQDGKDDVELGIQSLCRHYGRGRSDQGWTTPGGDFPGDACNTCADRAWNRISDARRA